MVYKEIEKNMEYLNRVLRVKESFDLIERRIEIGERKCVFYFIDGMTKDEVMLKIMDSFFGVTKETMPKTAKDFNAQVLPYVEVDTFYKFDDVVRNILSGVTCLFVDGYSECIAIDCRTYPARGVDEPEKDKSMRGSRDGFVETIVFNTALVRRRIRDPRLTMQMFEVGTVTRTDVAVCYMSGCVEEQVLHKISDKIKQLNIEGLPMNQQSLAEALFKRKWFNPFPKFKFTERPDTAAECIMEGKIVIFVDNSPAAMILPTNLLDMIEEANDYYFPTITNIYLKFARTVITLGTVFLIPLFLLFMKHPEWVSDTFQFIIIGDKINVPIIWQFLILEVAIDGMRLAALNTPSMLSTPLSVIAGIVVGEFAVRSGWFNSEVMLYMSFVAVANYTQPNFELGYALKFMRILILVLTALFDLPGFVVGSAVAICFVLFNRTLTGKNYFGKNSK